MSDLDILLEKYDELHDLLCDYNQEEKYIERIHNTIQKAIDELPSDSKIGIRPCGDQSKWLISNFDFSNVKIAGIFDKNIMSETFCGFHVYKTDSKEAQDVDVFIMTSYNWRNEIVSDIEKDKKKVLDIYNYLEQNNIELNASADKYIKGTHNILHDYWMEWKIDKDNEQALKNYLTAVCEAKDFFRLENICSRYERKYSFLKDIKRVYNEFYGLLKKLIAKRNDKKDIIIYLIDAVPYKWRYFFENLEKLSEQGISFSNAYTSTPYTHHTLRAMFSGYISLDDVEKTLEKIGYDNSELMKYLIDKNYQVYQIGHDSTKKSTRSMQEEYVINMDKDTSCNTVLWETICRMLESEKPVFYIAHFVVETHPPMICAELDKLNYLVNEDNYMKQFAVSAKYIDRRVMYYHDVMKGGNKIQIYMSDHGEHITHFPERYWMQNKLHACFFVSGRHLKPGCENRIFSYMKFKELVKWLIEPEKYDYEKCLSEYALFQDTDIYSEMLADSFIRRGSAEYALGYRGALDGFYKYAVNRLGREFFYMISEDRDIEIDKGEAPEKYNYLKKISGTYFPDLTVYEKFKYVKKLYAAVKDNES